MTIQFFESVSLSVQPPTYTPTPPPATLTVNRCPLCQALVEPANTYQHGEYHKANKLHGPHCRFLVTSAAQEAAINGDKEEAPAVEKCSCGVEV